MSDGAYILPCSRWHVQYTLNTQILQIHNYIKEHPELTLTDTYVDNGFTGTNFDRPEFERMMQDVRTGKIQCIVVKDYCAIIGLNQKDLENQGILA